MATITNSILLVREVSPALLEHKYVAYEAQVSDRAIHKRGA